MLKGMDNNKNTEKGIRISRKEIIWTIWDKLNKIV
jgi:hypothetical protein